MGEMAFEQRALVKAVETAWQEEQQERAAEALRRGSTTAARGE